MSNRQYSFGLNNRNISTSNRTATAQDLEMHQGISEAG